MARHGGTASGVWGTQRTAHPTMSPSTEECGADHLDMTSILPGMDGYSMRLVSENNLTNPVAASSPKCPVEVWQSQ